MADVQPCSGEVRPEGRAPLWWLPDPSGAAGRALCRHPSREGAPGAGHAHTGSGAGWWGGTVGGAGQGLGPEPALKHWAGRKLTQQEAPRYGVDLVLFFLPSGLRERGCGGAGGDRRQELGLSCHRSRPLPSAPPAWGFLGWVCSNRRDACCGGGGLGVCACERVCVCVFKIHKKGAGYTQLQRRAGLCPCQLPSERAPRGLWGTGRPRR